MSDNAPSLALLGRFVIAGEFMSVHPLKRGHIHKTWVSSWRGPHGEVRHFLHQCINQSVFKDIPGLMQNIVHITRHLHSVLQRENSTLLPWCLTLLPTRDGLWYVTDEHGQVWRAYHYLEGLTSYDVCPSVAHAFQIGLAFGRFLYLLEGLPAEKLTVPIAHFQDSPYRLQQLKRSHEADLCRRAAEVSQEMDFIVAHQGKCDLLGHNTLQKLPVRITHSDPKINNLLFNERGEALSVVDLDTCMPGSCLYDFGDMVRSAACSCREDERDLGAVVVQQDSIVQLVRGYAEYTRGILSPAEVALLADAPATVALTLGMRFLNDHLSGDPYFGVQRPGQNLDRARVQFELTRQFDVLHDKIHRAVQHYYEH